MDTDKLNKWLTLVANVGVLAGIIFLAFEVRQNNELLEAQGRAIRADLRLDGFDRLMDTEGLRHAWTKSREGDTLTVDDEALVRLFASTVLLNWQSSWMEFDAGLLDIEDISPEGWKADFETMPAVANRWSAMKYRLRPDFVAWMEENVVPE